MVKHGDKLRGKTVLCNCDEPFESAFFRYFALHFNKIGLAKLISISYAGSPMAGKEYPLEEDTSAYEAVVTEVPDAPLVRPDSSLDLEALFALPGNSLVHLARSEEHTSELQSLMTISYAVFCLKKQRTRT